MGFLIEGQRHGTLELTALGSAFRSASEVQYSLSLWSLCKYTILPRTPILTIMASVFHKNLRRSPGGWSGRDALG